MNIKKNVCNTCISQKNEIWFLIRNVSTIHDKLKKKTDKENENLNTRVQNIGTSS